MPTKTQIHIEALTKDRDHWQRKCERVQGDLQRFEAEHRHWEWQTKGPKPKLSLRAVQEGIWNPPREKALAMLRLFNRADDLQRAYEALVAAGRKHAH